MVNLLVFMPKSPLGIPKILKIIKILTFFFENAFKKIGIKKRKKIETKKLLKYAIFYLSFNKTLF